MAELTTRGLFLKNVGENLQQSVPLDVRHRRNKIVIYRLRMGHVALIDYLHQFKGTARLKKNYLLYILQKTI